MTVLHFIALDIPQPIKLNIQRICNGLPSTNWVEEDSFYILLQNLGTLEGSVLLDVQEQLSKIEPSTFNLTLSDCQFVPFKKRQGGRLCLRANSSLPLDRLVNSIRSGLKELHIALEPKQDPYVILGECHQFNSSKMANYLEMAHFFQTASFSTNRLGIVAYHHTAKHLFFSKL